MAKRSPGADYFMLLDEWMRVFFIGTSFPYSRQWSHIPYFPVDVPMIPEWMTEHFYEDGKKVGSKVRGSIGVVADFGGDTLRWVCFDLDSAPEVERAEPLLKKLDELNIAYLEELGGDDLERRHIWIKVDSRVTVAREFFTRLIMATYNLKTREECWKVFPEVFGINKENNLIRLPLGWHIKRNKRFPVIIPTTGEITDDPVEFMKAWLDMQTLTEMRMDKLQELFPPLPAKPIGRYQGKSAQFLYTPLNLPRIISNCPSLIEPVITNCQAANSVLEAVISDRMIDKPGEIHHAAGLYLAGLGSFNDGYMLKEERKRTTEGRDWFEFIRKNYRLRSDESHEWEKNFDTGKNNPSRVFPSCKAWEEKFDACNGCPYRGRIETPKQFIWGTRIQRKIVKPIKLVTPQEIRLTTFNDVRLHVKTLAIENRKDDILLASPQGSGKSVFLDHISCELAKEGKKILLAVPSTKLALEHKERLKEECGVDSFILSSHKAGFEHKLVDFECPDYDAIQRKISLGVSSSSIKSRHCQSCPLVDRCYYPRQYQEVMSPEHSIVIIQHAHLSTQEIVWELMKKKFDMLGIDESFIDTIFSSIRLNGIETNILKRSDFNWAKDIGQWLDGKNSGGWLNAEEEELQEVKLEIESHGIVWRLPELIRLYNQKRSVNPYVGIEIVHEIPSTPIRIFTDATPPEELLKSMTGIKDLTVYGRGEVIDYRKVHPDNRIIQVLDNSNSKTSLSNKEKFHSIFMKIGELIELKFPHQRGLLTVYKGDFKKVEEFYLQNREIFPTVLQRTQIERMDKGVNSYSHLSFQFLVAGVYFTGNDYLLQSYEYKEASNFHLEKEGLPTLSNIYPKESPELMSVKQIKVPISRIELDRERGVLVDYEGITTNRPQDVWHKYCYDYNVGKTQQAIRIRWVEQEARTVYVLCNYPLGVLIRDSICLEEFTRHIPSPNAYW